MHIGKIIRLIFFNTVYNTFFKSFPICLNMKTKKKNLFQTILIACSIKFIIIFDRFVCVFVHLCLAELTSSVPTTELVIIIVGSIKVLQRDISQRSGECGQSSEGWVFLPHHHHIVLTVWDPESQHRFTIRPPTECPWNILYSMDKVTDCPHINLSNPYFNKLR